MPGGRQKSFEEDIECKCAKGRDLNFIYQKLRRSSGLNPREENLEKKKLLSLKT
jgi:hypothetical protein